MAKQAVGVLMQAAALRKDRVQKGDTGQQDDARRRELQLAIAQVPSSVHAEAA